jgi:hypothetical protein
MFSSLFVRENKITTFPTFVLVKSSLNTQEVKGKQNCSHRMLSPKGTGSEKEFLLYQDVAGNKQLIYKIFKHI